MMNSCCQAVLWTLSLAPLVRAHGLGQPETFDLLPRQATTPGPRPYLGSVSYGTAITNCAVPGAVALTYDDGPGPYTAELLDTLLANGIHATFFILGNRNGMGAVDQTYPDLIKRMYREGHQIASHTWDHQSLESLTSAQRITEMTRNEAAFQNILGFIPTYMRPPYGFCYGPSGCLSDMGKLGYHVIDWSVDTKDYENDLPTLIVNAEKNWDAVFQAGNPATSSFIPLTHDIHQNTVEILAPYMIKEIKQKGYKFLTVGECLNDPVENWYRNPSTGQSISNRGVSQPLLSGSSSSSSSANVSSTSISTSTSRSQSTSTSAAVTTSTRHLSTSTSASSSSTTSSSALRPSNNSVQLTVSILLSSILMVSLALITS